MTGHTSGVYAITSPSGAQYVGSAVNVRRRWADHRASLARGDHHNRRLQRAWTKYGPQGFEFRQLLVCDKAMLVTYEQAAIYALQPEYSALKLAYSHLGAKRSAESCQRIAAANRLKRHSDETKERLSRMKLGKKLPPLSDETRAKIASANLGAKRSDAARAAMAAAQLGKRQSPETIAKRAAAIKAAWAAERASR